MNRVIHSACAAVVLGVALPSSVCADDWIHQSSSNTTFETAEIMRGDVTGVVVNIGGGDDLWAFRAVATQRFITVESGASNQPAAIYVLDSAGKPLSVGSGFHCLDLEPFEFTVDVGAAGVGQPLTLVFGNWGMMPAHASPGLGGELYDLGAFGQTSPILIETWNQDVGQNLSGSETRRYGLGGVTGIPLPCPSDVNGDTESDVLDFLDFIDSFGSCENQPAPCSGSSGADADFNGDTWVDVLDFLDYLDAFGIGCD